MINLLNLQLVLKKPFNLQQPHSIIITIAIIVDNDVLTIFINNYDVYYARAFPLFKT